MDNTAGVMCETGTANPSGTPGVCGVRVAYGSFLSFAVAIRIPKFNLYWHFCVCFIIWILYITACWWDSDEQHFIRIGH